VKVADNSFYGYVGNTKTSGIFVPTHDTTSALQISFKVPTGTLTSSQQNIITLNTNADLDIPQVGGMYGFGSSGDSMASGSYKYETFNDYLNGLC
jgi:hypothetical protein